MPENREDYSVPDGAADSRPDPRGVAIGTAAARTRSPGAEKSSFRILTSKTPFHVVEAYKTVRANLLFTLSTSPERSVILTSSEPDVGKSTASANLALAMAQTGARVLIVDADMRKPVQHKIFRTGNSEGLSKLLSGMCTLPETLRKTSLPNLTLIPAGPIPPNPSELLGSERMAALLAALSGAYDYIFFDSPPVNLVSDSLMFLDKVAGVLLIGRQKHTHYDELNKAAEKIRNLNGNVLGVVITDVAETNKPYASYKNYKYKSYEYEYRNNA